MPNPSGITEQVNISEGSTQPQEEEPRPQEEQPQQEPQQTEPNKQGKD